MDLSYFTNGTKYISRTWAICKSLFLGTIIGFGLYLTVKDSYPDSYRLFVTTMPIVSTLITYFWFKFYSKCPSCKKPFCTRKIDQKVLREELARGTKQVDNRTVSTTFRIKDIEIYTKCDKCGFENSYTVTKKTEV